MASYDYNSRAEYQHDPNTGIYTLISGPEDISGTFTDNRDDKDTIDPGTSYDRLQYTGDLEFSGYHDATDPTLLLFRNPDYPDRYYVYSAETSANVDYPDQFSSSEVTTEPLTECFTGGTLIATPKGETVVESLKIGDDILTADGRRVPVKWVGRQTIQTIFTPAEWTTSVRVKANALDQGRPHTDLVLTAAHALIIDGLAINASALVNGATIVWEPADELVNSITFYHVETEDHDVLLANGAAAETFIDYVGRRAFDNYQEYIDLYGAEQVIQETGTLRISSRRLVPKRIRERLELDASNAIETQGIIGTKSSMSAKRAL